MPRKPTAKATGVWEKDPGSGVWWIRYRAEGRLKREKVGRRSDAIALYQLRKSEVRAGAKLPQNMRTKGATFAEIAKDAEKWYASHGKKDIRNVKSRMKFLVKKFGNQPADQITPAQVDHWISEHEQWSPATGNRYKALMSKAFKIALASGKASRRFRKRRATSRSRCRAVQLQHTGCLLWSGLRLAQSSRTSLEDIPRISGIISRGSEAGVKALRPRSGARMRGLDSDPASATLWAFGECHSLHLTAAH